MTFAILLKEISAVENPPFYKYSDRKSQRPNGLKNLSQNGKISMVKISICSKNTTNSQKDGALPSRSMQFSPGSKNFMKQFKDFPKKLKFLKEAFLLINMCSQR